MLKKAVKNTYKKSIASQLHPLRKLLTLQKTPKKVDKTVKFADKWDKNIKYSNKTSKIKLKANNKKNTTSNTISEIQMSDSNQGTDIDENGSDSVGLNNSPDLVMTSDSRDMGDTDETE